MNTLTLIHDTCTRTCRPEVTIVITCDTNMQGVASYMRSAGLPVVGMGG